MLRLEYNNVVVKKNITIRVTCFFTHKSAKVYESFDRTKIDAEIVSQNWKELPHSPFVSFPHLITNKQASNYWRGVGR